MNYDAMIIIDMQNALIEANPYNGQKVIGNIKKVSEACRQKNIPIIYIRHDGGLGDELEKGSAGWQICKDIFPQSGDKIIDKRFNSAFRQTELEEHLQSLHAKRLIMCGMQTEYCMDVSCKVAFEKEYHITIPKDTTTTFDNDFASGEALAEYYEEKIWKNRYADVVSMEEIQI
ncbi:cysteine hydrolase family protein [Konateibacter massiliensis]|uniref:cysteine hydrolase family protein n=1 Tax=Konateibacter massiliensis TaxID=2002841 RepID=UPI000C154334|nr:cysteine hydrolase family protein [Konateibacter massiliensis]